MKIKFEKSSDSSEDGVEYYDGELRMKITAKMDVKEISMLRSSIKAERSHF